MNSTCKALKIMPCSINIDKITCAQIFFFGGFFFFFFLEVLLLFKNLSIVNLQCARFAQILKHPTKERFSDYWKFVF